MTTDDRPSNPKLCLLGSSAVPPVNQDRGKRALEAAPPAETTDPLASKDHGIAASAGEIDGWSDKYLRVLSERDRALALLRQYLAEFPALRSKPVGAPHSRERSKQDAHIVLEDLARRAFDRPADETKAGLWTEEERRQSIECGAAREITPADAAAIEKALK